jgi:multidrug efflux system membrane fusion protein
MVAAVGGCQQREIPAPPIAVRVATLKAEPLASETRFSATVRERRRIELSFKISGTVAELLQIPGSDGKPQDVHEGDTVRCDPQRPLARLDEGDLKRRLTTAQERLAEAQAKGRAATATVTAVRLTFDRIKALREREAVPQQTYDETLGKRDSAVAELDAVQREVGAATVALQQAEDDLRNSLLVSPIPTAVVSRKSVERGERVQAGQPVFQIMDLSNVRVAFGVSDTKVGQFQIGQTVSVTADAFPGRQFLGRITKIAPAADLKTRTFEVEMTIDQPSGLRPGMVVTILVGRAESMVLLPMTAIARGQGKDEYTVYAIVQESGRKLARQRRVTLGGVYDNRIRLLEGGESHVRPGDVIVVAGAFRLTDGQVVRVVDRAEPEVHMGK